MDNVKESHLNLYRRWHNLARPYFQWQFQQFKPYLGLRVADIGCGLGNLTDFLLDREIYVGVDTDIEMIRQMQYAYRNKSNIELIHNDIIQPACVELLKEKKVDTILCINVLEHIKDDFTAFRNMISALVSGGTLCVLVPAFQFFFGSLDSLDGHYRRYTKNSMHQKLSQLPAKILRMYYFNLIGGLGWFLKGKILKQPTHSNDNYTLTNLLIPMMSKAENICKPPFGLSLIIILKK